jgi:DTW domain-containing protein YfiP
MIFLSASGLVLGHDHQAMSPELHRLPVMSIKLINLVGNYQLRASHDRRGSGGSPLTWAVLGNSETGST